MLSGCLGISRGWHSDVAHIYCEPQGTASYGNAAGFPVIVRTPICGDDVKSHMRHSVYGVVIMALPLLLKFAQFIWHDKIHVNQPPSGHQPRLIYCP